jgi:uncharacterized membrane protein (DUF4010 family)
VEEHFGAALVALVTGALLGLERQRSSSGDPGASAGLRTFALFSLAGFLAAHLSQAGVPLAFPVGFLGMAALVTVSYIRSSKQDPGLTTEMAALVAALLGALIGLGQAPLAVAIAVVVAVLLAEREPLRRFVAALTEAELLAILKFAIVAVVLLPLLPERPIGPYDAIVPRRVGIVVTAICGLSLLGYVLVRLVGRRAGFALAGMLGGLVSSTAVTLGFSGRAKANPALAPALASGIVLASIVVYLRGFTFLALFDSPVAWYLGWRALLLVAVGAAAVFWGREQGPVEKPGDLALGNPVELGRAATLGLAFAAILVIGRTAQALLGTAGFWATCAVAGLVDVDSVLVSGVDLHKHGLITPQAAGGGFLLATVANLLAKGAIVATAGGAALARRVLPGFAVMGVVTAILLLWP